MRLLVASAAILACIAAPVGAKAPPGFFGTVSITSLDTADYYRMENIGATRLRFLMLWNGIHPTHHGDYNWAGPDAIVSNAASHGIQLLPIMIGTPSYLSGCSSRDCAVRLPVYSKAQRSSWEHFVRAAVRRYGPDGTFWDPSDPSLPYDPIRSWQIWNEENNANLHAKPKDYAKLVKISDDTIKAVDPHANVVLGGLAGNVSSGHPHPTAQAYLDDLYNHGAKSSFEQVALHPYAQKVKDVAHEIKAVRGVMRHHHDGSRRLLITEIGWGSGAPREQHEFVLTPKGQKRRLTQSFKLLLAHRTQWHLGGVYWFDWRDPAHGKDLCGFCYSSGLLKHNGGQKPAFQAFKHFTSP
jgi:polysaccharide biosynthesis protein PslG